MTETLRLKALAAETLLRAGATGHVEAQGRPDGPPQAAASDDLELARRCVAGDDAAQREFVGRYSRIVFSACRRKGLSPEAAEDVSQEVFLDAFRGLARFRGESRLGSWLFTLTLRRIATHYRSPSRRLLAAGHPGDDGFPAAGVDTGFEARAAEAERAAAVRRAVDSLGEPARTVMIAYYVGESSVAEIAAELGLSPGGVKSHLHRGRAAVRRRLETT